MNTNEQDNMQKRELVRDLFLKLDKDGSGAVEAKEIALALNMYLVYYIYMLFVVNVNLIYIYPNI